ncbi:MAG: tripartite tricarboxylate transporter substrate binding protein [Variovorax sp.]|nr:MAG: tripartite tricarboxylate transporter substrate binding protein [Variovorax sp.]
MTNEIVGLLPVRRERARSIFDCGLKALLGAATAAFFAVTALPSHADNYPSQPVKLIVPFTAGGGSDSAARVIAEQMQLRLKQPFVVENRPGASAGVGAGTVARAAPNGYTLLVGTATLAANAVVSPTPNLDIVNDFEFIGKFGQIDLVLVTNPKVPAKDMRELLELMRTRPDTISFGSPGTGAPAHLGVELLKLVTKTQAVHVPYKGESAAVTDLIGGHVSFQLCAPFVCAPRVQDGSLKALAIAAPQRSKLMPNVPTMAEAGVNGVEAGTWYYIAAPKGTPEAIVRKLNTALNEVLADQKVKTHLLSMGVETAADTTPAAVKGALQAEMEKWRPVVKAAGVKN